MSELQGELYKHHEGTVMVSGKSEVGKVARYIVHLIQKGTVPVDVLFIGANAGQQAYKACAVARIIAKEELSKSLAFVTERSKTETESRDAAGRPIEKEGKPVMEVKDAFIWQVIIIP